MVGYRYHLQLNASAQKTKLTIAVRNPQSKQESMSKGEPSGFPLLGLHVQEDDKCTRDTKHWVILGQYIVVRSIR